jgi:hypothetical protein
MAAAGCAFGQVSGGETRRIRSCRVRQLLDRTGSPDAHARILFEQPHLTIGIWLTGVILLLQRLNPGSRNFSTALVSCASTT